MNPLKKLAGQTAVYGLSSIIGRFLNFLLVPLHTRMFNPEQFGVITEMYAYVAFLVVLLNYGLETAFFRFAGKEKSNMELIFGTAIKSLVVTTTLFIAAAFFWAQPLAELLQYPEHQEFVKWFAIIIGLDAIASIPLARLRIENKPVRFALVNLGTVGVNIGLNLFFIGYCMPAYERGVSNFFIDTFYNPEIGVGYVFIANLIASIFKIVALLPVSLKGIRLFSPNVLRAMLTYGLPLIFVGFAGIVNETLDRILLKYLLVGKLGIEATMEQVGIYGACYKLAIIMNLFIQAYRYAAEPFFFAHEKEKDSKKTYATILTYFVIICSAIFLLVLLYLDLFRYFIPNPAFWEGLTIVPILLFANIFLGIYYNLSVWYKLSDNTGKGALVSIIGAIITIGLNVLLIPVLGYHGAAWTTLACYFSMSVISWLWGRVHYPIPYDIGRVVLYLVTALGLYLVSTLTGEMIALNKYLINTVLFFVFVLLVWFKEFRGKNRIFGA